MHLKIIHYNNFNGAIQAYQRALKIKPNDEINLNKLGEVLWNAKRFPEALDHFKRALKINPKYPYAHLNLGQAFALVNDKATAIVHTRYSAKLFRKSGDKNGETKARQSLSVLYE